MHGSINFLFHLLGFALFFTSLLGGWIIERRIQSEKDLTQKLFIGKINRRFFILFPLASGLMLLTGMTNILGMYSGSVNLLYTEGWMIAKIILFAFMVINGLSFGPILVRRRTKLLQRLLEKTGPDDSEATLKVMNKSISTFYLVQFLLLLIIMFLSVAGGQNPSGSPS